MGVKIVSGAKGKMGRLFIASNELCAEDWDISEVGNEEDTTSTCDAGNSKQEIGVKGLEGTINATWDVSVNPYDDPPGLTLGKKLANTKLYIHADPNIGAEDGPFYALTLHIMSGVQTSVPVKGKVGIVVPFKSFGSFTLPTGSDSSNA